MDAPVRSEEAPPMLGHAEIRSILLGIMLAMLLAALDQTIVATALPTIGADLNDFANLSWVVTSYLLASTAVTPLYGKLSDIHGRGVMMTGAVVLFTLGSIACALAPSMLVLILARGLQGLGGGGLISLAQTIIADIIPPRERGRYQAMIASVFAASSIAGPVLGGVIAQHLDWSMIFWINLPLGVGAFLMIRKIMGRLPRHERPHKLDLPGALLLIVSAVSLMLALSWGGVFYPWASPQVIGLLIVAGVGSVAFVWRMRTNAEPFLPLDMMANQVVATGIAGAFFMYGLMIALTIATPLYFETAWHLSSSAAGLALIPQMAGTVAGAISSGRAMARLKNYKLLALLGSVASTLCLAIIATLPAGASQGLQIALLAIASMGMGTVFPLSTVAIQNAVPPHQLGTVTGAANFFRALGGALFVAILGAVLLGTIGGGEAGDMNALAANAEPALLLHAFHLVFGTAAAVSLLGTICVFAMRQLPLKASVAHNAELSLVE